MTCKLSVLLFLIVIFCCNKKDSSYFNIEKFVGDTLVTNIKNLIIVLLILLKIIKIQILDYILKVKNYSYHLTIKYG